MSLLDLSTFSKVGFKGRVPFDNLDLLYFWRDGSLRTKSHGRNTRPQGSRPDRTPTGQDLEGPFPSSPETLEDREEWNTRPTQRRTRQTLFESRGRLQTTSTLLPRPFPSVPLCPNPSSPKDLETLMGFLVLCFNRRVRPEVHNSPLESKCVTLLF